MRFEDKVVIVTGGGQGIGRAVARAYASEGANVIIAESDSEAGMENAGYITGQGHKAYFIPTDVSVESSVKNMVQKVLERFGTVDILINNAGVGSSDSIFDDGMDAWDRVLAINLRGTYMCAKYCAKAMVEKDSGCIINIASTRAFMSEPDTGAYSASKGGIIALTHSLAVTLGKHGIRVNSISPGWIDVSAWKRSDTAKQAHLTELDHSQHPAGRVGTPMDIAGACLYLSSADAGFITGTNLTIDGGMTVKMIYV